MASEEIPASEGKSHEGRRSEFDVIIPVYNALSQTARCIESVLRCSQGSYRLILINDASDWETTAYLRKVAAQVDSVVLLENEQNLGFLHTANRGLAYGADTGEGYARYKIILNSDTVVSDNWLEAFRDCFCSDPSIGLVTPLSNNAENLSIEVPEGYDYRSFSQLLFETIKVGQYPDIATAIGFCMGIRTVALEQIGYFDEVFAPGYAEDSDMHFKALCRAWRSVLLTNCFVYHESHASFSEKKQQLVARNRPIFDQRWSVIYKNELAYHNFQRPIEAVAKGISPLPVVEHDIVFILPTSKLCGGIIVVYEIVNRLIQRGINASAIILTKPVSINMDLLFTPYFRPEEDWRNSASPEIPKAKAYVATHYETVSFASIAHAQYPDSKLAYLIQGYESWFPGASIERVVNTYRAIPNRVVVSQWLGDMLKRWGFAADKIPNGVDAQFFYPNPQKEPAAKPGECTILTMLREDPQGGWRIMFNALKRIRVLHPNARLIAVGDLCQHPAISPYLDESFVRVDRKEMRSLYQRSDIFIDASLVQGFGLMGLEAMACGVATVLTKTGGTQEYASEENAICCGLGDEGGIVDGVARLLTQPELLAELKEAGRRTAEKFSWDCTIQCYHDYFTRLIAEGDDVTLVNAQAMNRYLFEHSLRYQRTVRALYEAFSIMNDELRSIAPRPLNVLLKSLGREELLQILNDSDEGASIAAIYERSRETRVQGNTVAADGLTQLGTTSLLAAVQRLAPGHVQ